jgi:peptide/nickel transport system substrate-binding protein
MHVRISILIASLMALFLGSANASPLRYAEDRAPGIIHPVFATTMSEARINELIFEGLFADNLELMSTPKLATDFTLSDDRLSMIIRLKAGVKWHDDTDFTAEDVVFSIQAYKRPATRSPEAGRVKWIAEAKAIDSLSVELKFVAEEYVPEDKLHFKIIPKHRFKSADLKRTGPFRNQPIGTGPFKVIGFNPDNSVSLAKFQSYHGHTKLDEVIMREVSDPNYQSKLLIYQSLETIVRVLPKDIAMLQNSRDVDLYPYQTNSWWYLGFNLRKRSLSDDLVREAVHLLVDVEHLLAPIGTGEILSGPFVKASPFYNHQVRPRLHNPKRAASLLEDAGYIHDGKRWTKNGKPLVFKIATLKDLPTAQDVVINIQSQLMKSGITLEPTFMTVPEWKRNVWQAREFDLILSQWSFDRNENIYEQFHSKGTRNFTSYANSDVDNWLEAARKTGDPKEKKSLYRQAHAQIHKDNPMVFLWTLDSYAALSSDVSNVVIHPFYFFTWADDWQLP